MKAAVMRDMMSGGFSADPVKEVQKVLGCALPTPLLDLYQNEDTDAPDEYIPMRLMPPSEVIDFHQVVEDMGWATKGVRVFWTDDNSNYTGLYVTGPLEEKVCFIDHEETDLSPVYASLQSFLAAMSAARPLDLDWPDFSKDYPAAGPPADRQAASRDWEIVQSLRPWYEANRDDERTYYAFCMMALTPFDRTASLLAFTHDTDMYIQERACEILGLRRYRPATDRLAELARNGMPNGQLAAIRALGQIGSREAHSHLRELLPLLPKGNAIYIKAALKQAH